jgi:hypothetical protein
MRFNRKIGDYAGKYFTTDGRELTKTEWEAYAPSVLPTAADDVALAAFFKNPDWIAPKGNLSVN